MKFCKDCKETKCLDQYYKAGANSTQTRCKKCHNIFRNTCKRTYARVIYKTPFEKLPDETQAQFKDKYKTIPLAQLARELNLNYPTVASWQQKGFLISI